MLTRQIIFVCIILPFTEYYSYAAICKVIKPIGYGFRLTLWITYFVLSLCIILGLVAFPLWATTSWPSQIIRFIVTFIIAMFLGKLLVASLMFLGDILLILKKVLLIIAQLIRIKKKSPGNGYRITRSRFISQSALFCGALLTSSLVYGTTNKYNYKVRHVQLPLNGLPPELSGLRIVQVSDIHAGSFNNKEAVKSGVDMVIRENPDLILFTGDLVNYRTEEINPYIDIFGKVSAPLGVYSILGNHDYGDYISWISEEAKIQDFELMKDAHKALGWHLLRNEHVLLNHKGKDFALIGVENWSTKARFPKYGDLEKAMSGLENTEPALKILMTHDPSHWDGQVIPNHPEIAVTLSGHTHGMQLGIDIPGLKWSPAQYIYDQWAGLYRKGDQLLYVNRGFGFIGYDGRLGILPEITVLEFV